MKIYQGKRPGPAEKSSGMVVTVDGQPLKHRVRHSPTGFEWGYLGSGPSDLALSILWDFLGKEPTRIDYMYFKEQFVARWKNSWQITGEEIRNFLDKFEEPR